jgi:hypothetical protein
VLLLCAHTHFPKPFGGCRGYDPLVLNTGARAPSIMMMYCGLTDMTPLGVCKCVLSFPLWPTWTQATWRLCLFLTCCPAGRPQGSRIPLRVHSWQEFHWTILTRHCPEEVLVATPSASGVQKALLSGTTCDHSAEQCRDSRYRMEDHCPVETLTFL